jgi:septal ring factor EnvC (AmiA/AmiB activator)
MRPTRLATVAMFAAVFGASGCTRAAQEEVREETAEVEQEVDQLRQRRVEETARLQQRVNELERKWEQAQTKLAGRTDAAATRAKAEIRDELADAKRELAELETVVADNWWDRHQREWARAATDTEAAVKRSARRWTPAVEDKAAAVVGDSDTWAARRDRLVNAAQKRIDGMEQALRDIDGPDVDKEDLEATRTRVRMMREENERLRKATDDDWWDITRDRVTRTVDRIEDRIDRLVTDN